MTRRRMSPGLLVLAVLLLVAVAAVGRTVTGAGPADTDPASDEASAQGTGDGGQAVVRADPAGADQASADQASADQAADGDGQAASPPDQAPGSPDPVTDGPVTLPDDIVWETNMDDPLIGSPDAIRGGTFTFALGQYPLTFRLMGPNSNDEFAGWNRAFTMSFALVSLHPVTENFIPLMATHWSVQDDLRTIYFRLDPDARWSDGEPITADDFVFTWEMMQSEHIVDPFYNLYSTRIWESVDRIDDYTLRVVGTEPSWRPLYEYGGLWPTAEHATVLDEDWVTRTQNEPQIAVGPYVVSNVVRGESVTFERLDEWWGDDKRYFIGQYNFDRINLRVVPTDRVLDYLRQGDLDMIYELTARTWNEEYAFPAVQNGWVRRARVFVQSPEPLYGLHMNLEAPIFQNRDFRKAMQHLFNFERLNRNLMYDEYFRIESFFGGTPFANTDLDSYGFDPILAREYLERAGYRRPEDLGEGGLLRGAWNTVRGLLATRSSTDDVLVNEDGEKASFELIYDNPGITGHLTVMQQEYRRAGVDLRLRLLEGGTAFQRGLERKYEMITASRGPGYYPDPRQYFHSQFQPTTNNNNIWGFGSDEVDELIEVWEDSLEEEERLAAMHRIDEIVHDEAFYIPFWAAPYIRLVYWDYIRFPEFYLPKLTSSIYDYMVYWIDPEARTRLEGAMARGEALPLDDDIDKDYWGIREGESP